MRSFYSICAFDANSLLSQFTHFLGIILLQKMLSHKSFDKISGIGDHLRYPLPYPLPGFFPTTLPEPYPKSKSPTRHSLLSSCSALDFKCCRLYYFCQNLCWRPDGSSSWPSQVPRPSCESIELGNLTTLDIHPSQTKWHDHFMACTKNHWQTTDHRHWPFGANYEPLTTVQ